MMLDSKLIQKRLDLTVLQGLLVIHAAAWFGMHRNWWCLLLLITANTVFECMKASSFRKNSLSHLLSNSYAQFASKCDATKDVSEQHDALIRTTREIYETVSSYSHSAEGAPTYLELAHTVRTLCEKLNNDQSRYGLPPKSEDA